MRERKKVSPETAIKKMVKQYLQIKGWFIFPLLAGLGAYRGIADFYIIKDGRGIWLEIKTERGKQSDHQVKFQADIESHGGEYMVCRDIQELIDIGM